MLHSILSLALAMNLLFSIGSTGIAPYPYAVSDPALSGYTQKADGRYIGGVAEGGLGTTLTNQFFSYRVNSAEPAAEYGGKTPAEGNVFLVASITVTSTRPTAVPIFADDFQVQWGGEGEDNYGYPILDFSKGLEEEWELYPGDSITGLAVYEVPAFDSPHEYSISYQELYEDDVAGNTFYVQFELPADAATVTPGA
jgi:hypothetical protein